MFLESFSRVSRANLERYSSDTRAIFERYSSDTRDISDTSPVHLRSALEWDSCLLEGKGRNLDNSAKPIFTKSYRIMRNLTRNYQFKQNSAKFYQIVRNLAKSHQIVPSRFNARPNACVNNPASPVKNESRNRHAINMCNPALRTRLYVNFRRISLCAPRTQVRNSHLESRVQLAAMSLRMR